MNFWSGGGSSFLRPVHTDNLPAIPTLLREPLRRVLRGEVCPWPSGMTAADSEAFGDAISLHGMAPLVFERASALHVRWPPSVMARLRGVALHAAAAEPLRQRDLLDVIEAFRRASIEVLILKGSALAYQIYAAPEHRPRADTDLLIRRTEVEAARALLESHGYAGRVLSGDPLANRQQAFARVDPFGVEHVYDLHWDVTNTPVVRNALGFEELLARSVPVTSLHESALAPSMFDALLLACIHRAAHHHDSERLIWLYDIHLLHGLMSDDERTEFRRQAALRGVSAICARSLLLAEEWFAVGVSDSIAQWSVESGRAGEPSARFLDHERRQASVLVEDLRALGWRERLQRLRDLALPPAAFLRASFPSAPRAALPVLYLWRATRGVMRLFGRVRQKGDAT